MLQTKKGGYAEMNPAVRDYRYVLNAADCDLVLPGMLRPVPPREALAECFKKGATIVWDQDATEKARATVKARLGELSAR
ncbi:hypothetical protein [Desulfatitalea alkaliphila]|uniref:Uncharacterized protein n=1 Tax=Desulfatitalea alkaliphila TaxID=2929485 RepID=A0AA41R1D1_9BACT|nr:hypothetical protein [Desulfatitalea alkaliphila]MCJ8500214.1 hypothetical protein [Desulfatitalea alkaliphila]